LIEDFLEPDLINSILRISQTVPNEDFHQIEKIKDAIMKKFRILAI